MKFKKITKKSDEFQSVYALLVGVNRYQQKYKTLKWALADLTKFGSKYLSDVMLNAKDHVNIEYLANELATKERIDRAIENIEYNSDAGDLVFFYYSGHGKKYKDNEVKNEKGAIITSDEKEIGFNYLRNKLLEIEAKYIFVFIDSCYSGCFQGKLRNDLKTIDNKIPSVLEHHKEIINTSFKTDTHDGKGKLIAFTSCAKNQESGESYFANIPTRILDKANVSYSKENSPPAVGYGIFTHYLVEVLTDRNFMKSLDSSIDGNSKVFDISLSETFKQVKKQIKNFYLSKDDLGEKGLGFEGGVPQIPVLHPIVNDGEYENIKMNAFLVKNNSHINNDAKKTLYDNIKKSEYLDLPDKFFGFEFLDIEPPKIAIIEKTRFYVKVKITGNPEEILYAIKDSKKDPTDSYYEKKGKGEIVWLINGDNFEIKAISTRNCGLAQSRTTKKSTHFLKPPIIGPFSWFSIYYWLGVEKGEKEIQKIDRRLLSKDNKFKKWLRKLIFETGKDVYIFKEVEPIVYSNNIKKHQVHYSFPNKKNKEELFNANGKSSFLIKGIDLDEVNIISSYTSMEVEVGGEVVKESSKIFSKKVIYIDLHKRMLKNLKSSAKQKWNSILGIIKGIVDEKELIFFILIVPILAVIIYVLTYLYE